MPPHLGLLPPRPRGNAPRLRLRYLRLAGVALLLAAGCSPAKLPPPSTANAAASTPTGFASDFSWTTTLDCDHPLAGRVWDVAREAFVSPQEMATAAQSATFVLLGEKHDNPDHHRLQAWVLEAMAARGRRPTVAFEMIDTAEQPAVDRYRTSPGASARDLGAALDWSASGWPAWSEYQPIAEIAFRFDLPIIGANLPRDEARSIVHHGLPALGENTVVALGLDRPLPADLGASLRRELADAHCGHLPDAMLDPMSSAQRARDATMAAVLLRERKPDGVVLIAGAGHARKDRGVPWYLQAKDPAARTLSVAFVEVEAGEASPAAYARRFGAERFPFDYLSFTPRKDDDDPCAAFRKKP